jgi:hypothetical protein
MSQIVRNATDGWRVVGKCAGDSGAERMIGMRIQIPESAHPGPINQMCQREWRVVSVRKITEQDSGDGARDLDLSRTHRKSQRG